MNIYHIVLSADWAAFDGGEYAAASLVGEGFIHCSYAHQIDGVLERYYSGADSVVILNVDTELLTSKFVEEPSTGGEVYPHIYGTKNTGAIVGTEERKL